MSCWSTSQPPVSANCSASRSTFWALAVSAMAADIAVRRESNFGFIWNWIWKKPYEIDRSGFQRPPFSSGPAKAVDRVVVHHPHTLHEGVHRGGADEIEPGLAQPLAHRVGFRGLGWIVAHGLTLVHPWRPADEAPQPFHGIALARFQIQPGQRVLPDREDLPAMADDSGIEDELLKLRVGHLRDLFRNELMEDLAVALPLLEHGPPGKPGLRARQADALEEVASVVGGHAPLGVVIFAIQIEVRGQPGAAEGFHDVGG